MHLAIAAGLGAGRSDSRTAVPGVNIVGEDVPPGVTPVTAAVKK